ncbi:MAG: tripartite tricarboxylate transporter substrate binding protein [Thermodesulfobacteriota bacterium]
MKKKLSFLVVVFGLIIMNPLSVLAGEFPEKEISFLVGFAPGGSTDTTVRLVATASSKKLGQAVVVVNKPGAGGALALSTLATSKADGYTIGNFNISAPMGNVIKNTDPFNVLTDFTPICSLTSFPNIMVVPEASPFKKLAELVQAAKKKPGDLSCASSGVGTSQHFGLELFKSVAKVNITHVAHKGSTPAVTALLGGHIACGNINSVDVIQHIKVGKLRALCVTSPQRIAELPEVPSIAEAGYPEAAIVSWVGCAAPAGTPAPVISKLAETFREALNQSEVQAKLKEIGFTLNYMAPEAFKAFVKKEYDRYKKIAETAGIKE